MGQNQSQSPGVESHEQQLARKRDEMLPSVDTEITAFVEAASVGDVEQVQLGLQNLNAADASGDTALLVAAQHGQLEVVKLLLQSGNALHLNCLDLEKANALMLAAGSGEAEIVEVLLAAGIKCNAKDSNGWDASHHAAASGSTQVLENLKQAGLDVTHRTDRLGWTTLHIASHEGHVAAVIWLLEHGANPHHQDQSGNTACYHAENDHIIKVLECVQTVWDDYGREPDVDRIKDALLGIGGET